nr:MAG TPA: hypothetical protein [Bacteriophage sp.]
MHYLIHYKMGSVTLSDVVLEWNLIIVSGVFQLKRSQ